MKCSKIISVLLGMLLLAGCSTLSPYSSKTKLDLTLTGGHELNPDVHGRASPLVMRLLELKNPAAFENADFFSLYERGKDILAQDLIAIEELELLPGQTQKLQLTVNNDSRYIGVLAAYRDLPETQWRYVVTVRAEEVTTVNLYLDQNGIRDTTAELAKAGD